MLLIMNVFLALAKIFNKIFLVKEIKSQTGEVHFRRWCFMRLPWFRLYLHNITLPDYDAHRHDHPWNFVSLILRGSYLESWCRAPNYHGLNAATRTPGAFVYHPRSDVHRIEHVYEPVWTLVFAFGSYRQWGYRLWVEKDSGYLAWMDHKTYRQAKRDNLLAYEDHAPNEPECKVEVDSTSTVTNITIG